MLNKSCRFYLLILIILSTVCCNPFSKNSSRIAIIEGKINPSFTTNHFIYFYEYTDSLSLFFCNKVPTDSCEIKPDGSFRFEIKQWNKSGFFDLGTTNNIFARNFFLQPGDQLNLVFEGNEMPPKLNYSDKIGKYNLFLQTYSDTFYRNPHVKEIYYKTSNYLMAPDYSVYINNRRIEQFNFFKNYFKKEEIDTVFKFYFENETNYNWANDKLYFLWKKRIRKEVVPVDSSYFDFLKIVQVDNRRALICPAYTRFINLYIRELLDEKTSSITDGITPSFERFELAKNKLAGTGLQIAYYNFLRDELSGVDANEKNAKHDSVINEMLKIAYTSTKDSSFYYFARTKK
jgi:hypothetical protein